MIIYKSKKKFSKKPFVLYFRGNTTFAQLEIRDSNNSIVKRITFNNGSNEAAPTLKLVTTDGNKEIIRQDVKPHEIRHLFVPKVYHENKSRAGFINNRRKDANKSVILQETTENVFYIPPEKLEGIEKEVDVDPDEEFQVDESNHGLYLLNYSDTENVTQSPVLNKSTINTNIKYNSTTKVESTTITSNISKEIVYTTSKPDDVVNKNEKIETNAIANSTETKNTKLIKIENEKDKENRTLFMSDEIYNHFRPLEAELPVEDMAPFIFFGQKIGGQAISDNLTNSPSISASTKSVNYIAAPSSEKRKYNSRYSATEKYRNTSADEEEVNEDMDVSVVKNVIEKNKIRNTVKGPAPGRHVGLVNAYRKYPNTTQSPSTSANIAQLNVTEPIVQNVTPSTLDRNKNSNRTNSTNLAKETSNKAIATNTTNNYPVNARANTTAPVTSRNYTRNYFNIRRRPSRLTASSSTENIPFTIIVNATTEKASTTVYTAVVTSVSITSSIKGMNKTDELVKESDNITGIASSLDLKNATTSKIALLNDTETTTIPTPLSSTSSTTPSTTPPTTSTTTTQTPSLSPRSYKHRIRIRTTTTESSLNQPFSSPYKSTVSSSGEFTKHVGDLKHDATSRLPERLANLYRQTDYDNSSSITTGGPIRPKNILTRRRRPTTTTSTTTTSTSTTAAPIITPDVKPEVITTPITIPTQSSAPTTTPVTETENTFKTFIVTSRTSSESSSKPIIIPRNSTQTENKTIVNETRGEDQPSQNEEVVIEAEKNYTASYVLAGLGFLPVMAIVAFVLRNIMNKKTKEIDTEYEGYFDDGEIKKESPITPVARPPLTMPTKPDQKWEFPRNKLRLQTLLGQGNFGQVNMRFCQLTLPCLSFLTPSRQTKGV